MSHDCHNCHSNTVSSVNQTLDELDFERGIWSAALDGNEDRVRMLLSKGVDPNTVDKGGYTALHYAARSGHVGTCRILLEHGGDVNSVTRAGKSTALHRAALAGKDRVVELLLKHKADIKQKDADNRTALQRAREGNNKAVESLLLKACPELDELS